ncbi:hypothetical protein HanRHA438_Chr02g0081541 [Helianthus annuus]|nr:hypothetical protein HanRHA438_Chr02g0081541 [Helianthus annuus]
MNVCLSPLCATVREREERVLVGFGLTESSCRFCNPTPPSSFSPLIYHLYLPLPFSPCSFLFNT